MDVDDDIEFDFFEDEAATTEGPARVRLPRRSNGGDPRRRYGPPRGAAPLVRLLLLVGLVVFLVLFFGLLIQSCASASKHDSYAHYMDKVAKIAADSTSNGKQLIAALTTSGLAVTDIERKLRGIANQEQQNVVAAENLNPPGRLRDENQHLVEALELRVSGVQGLATTFQKTAKSTNTTDDAALLAAQAERLTASDIVWDDLFLALARQQLDRDNVSGVRVPESHFVSNPELITVPSMVLVLQRIRGAAQGTITGSHGTNIGTVTAQPAGTVLSANSVTTVAASADLAFQVVVHNGGDAQEVQIPVTVTVDRPQPQGGPITKTQTIDVINPGEDRVVTFSGFEGVPFSLQTNVRVDVKTVPGELNKLNNSTAYPVIFSLP